MTKKFCDICEAPASDSSPLEFDTEWGKPYIDAASTSNSKKQCFITSSVRFGFKAHKAGFGGPPDLCKPCMKKLAQKLVDQI